MNPYDLAMRYVGIHERPGAAIEPFIAFVNHLAGGPETEDPWCGSFVYFIAHFNLGLESPTLPRRARSWLTVGDIIAFGDSPGDVVILSRGPLPQPGPDVLDAPGHVGFLAPEHALGNQHGADEILLVSGNVSDAVTLKAFPISRVLGVRRLRFRAGQPDGRRP